eukprot:scaffold1638_cov258-Pinguiococcus_pyrenoidosus.AAC.53
MARAGLAAVAAARQGSTTHKTRPWRPGRREPTRIGGIVLLRRDRPRRVQSVTMCPGATSSRAADAVVAVFPSACEAQLLQPPRKIKYVLLLGTDDASRPAKSAPDAGWRQLESWRAGESPAGFQTA